VGHQAEVGTNQLGPQRMAPSQNQDSGRWWICSFFVRAISRYYNPYSIPDSLKIDPNIQYFKGYVKKGRTGLSEQEFDNILDQSFVD